MLKNVLLHVQNIFLLVAKVGLLVLVFFILTDICFVNFSLFDSVLICCLHLEICSRLKLSFAAMPLKLMLPCHSYKKLPP